MKIFLDTNIFLNLLLNRKGSEYARQILNSCAAGRFQGVICDITLLNIDYVASKQTKDLRNFLKIVNDTFGVIGVDNILFANALEIDNGDLEDSVQYVCAKKSDCSVIVTDDKSFYQGDIAIIGSEDFTVKYL